MSYIQKNLLVDETIIFKTKKSFIIFLMPLFWTVASIFFYFNSNPFVVKMTFLPVITAIIYWVSQWLQYYFSEFAITNKRILMREGFLFRHTNDTRLGAIAGVTVNQSLLGQLCGYGTVYVNAFGGVSDPFREIDKAFVFQKVLQEKLLSS